MAYTPFPLKAHKFVSVLVYTFLEWTLIVLLLLNAVFSYLIAKFAAYFGLQSPCIFCSRLDHVIEPGASYRDRLCNLHAEEVSKMGCCGRHGRFCVRSGLCEDCKPAEAGERNLRCSCCGVVMDSGESEPYLVLKQPLGFFGVTQKGNLEEEDGNEDFGTAVVLQECQGMDFGDTYLLAEKVECARDPNSVVSLDVVDVDIVQNVGNVDDVEDQSLKLDEEETVVDLLTDKDVSCAVSEGNAGIEGGGVGDNDSECIDATTLIERSVSPQTERVEDDGELGHGSIERYLAEQTVVCFPIIGIMDRDIPQNLEKFIGDYFPDQLVVPVEIQVVPEDTFSVEVELSPQDEDVDTMQGIPFEDDCKVMDTETNCEISIGSEICDQELIDRPQFSELAFGQSIIEFRCSEDCHEEASKAQVIGIELVESRDEDQSSVSPELSESEEEAMPETPNWIDGTPAPHKRFYFGRRESGTVSIDGSVASDVEGSEALTVDRLKAALKAERNALRSVYAELEEERSASTVAANQTMAMITRLQEEKAAMQMEAQQYQRMMEELSEYDQEALELTNELMEKREKEKQELEKELEFYRNKLFLYESEEGRKNVSSKGIGRSATSCRSSSAQDSDEISLDCHGSYEFFNILSESNANIHIDSDVSSEELPVAEKHLTTLDDSLADFEEERLAILEQLKALEEKLCMLDDEDLASDMESMEHIAEENGHLSNGNCKVLGSDGIRVMNGYSHDLYANRMLFVERRSISSIGKRLLPLFDATNIEKEDILSTNREEIDTAPETLSKYVIDRKEVSIAEEVINVYERLQVLEADREFLKHCISSLKKGDKGMDLLQEILQHLRDLRNVEFRVTHSGDSLASFSD